MNEKVIWLPLAIAALSLTSTAFAEHPSSSAATSGPTDLCAELDEFGNPARCKAVGPGMTPWWDAEVCCDARTCYEPNATGCPSGTTGYWCESAVLHSTGTLDCVYEVPTFCEVFPCGGLNITGGPLENAICCFNTGDCYDAEGGPCGGSIVWCGDGVSNEDGTVTCFDDEE